MSKKRTELDRKIKRATIKRLIGEGLNASQIAKQTGWPYSIVSLIYAQEQSA